MAKIIWTEEALADLHAIYTYISRESIANAENVGNKLIARVRKLEDFPNLGRMVPEFGDEKIRELIQCGIFASSIRSSLTRKFG